MNRMIVIAGLTLALGTLSGNVHAQTKPVAPAPVRAQPAAGADATFAAWDVDRNGSLSQQEFRTGWERVRRATRVQGRLRQQFDSVDANKNAAIDPAEYGNLLLIKDAGKAAPPLSSFDANKDGKLQMGEYLKLVQTLGPKETPKAKPR